MFTIEDRYNLTGMTITRTIGLGNFTGQPVSAVRPALDFVRHCRQPNIGRTSLRHTPPELGTTDLSVGFEWPGETLRTLTSMFNIIDSLAIIQRHTPAAIRMPDLATVPPEQVKSWLITAKALLGEDVTMTYPEGHCINVVLDTDVAIPDGEFGITVPMTVGIGNQIVDLGTIEVWLTGPTLVEHRQHEGRMHYAFTTPGRTVRYQRPAALLAT